MSDVYVSSGDAQFGPSCWPQQLLFFRFKSQIHWKLYSSRANKRAWNLPSLLHSALVQPLLALLQLHCLLFKPISFDWLRWWICSQICFLNHSGMDLFVNCSFISEKSFVCLVNICEKILVNFIRCTLIYLIKGWAFSLRKQKQLLFFSKCVKIMIWVRIN